MKTRLSRQGFTAVETLMAVFLFGLVAFFASHVLFKTTQSTTRNLGRQKASALAQMVLEQYDAYAARDYEALPSHDASLASPQHFFDTSDSLGYDGMTITSHTELAENQGSCEVTVTIGWGASGVQASTMTFVKTYAASSVMDTGHQEGSGI